MPVFTYTATLPTEATESGSIVADTPRLARERLRERGLAVRELRDAGTPRRGFSFRRRVARSTVTDAFSELATLLSVGVPLLEAVDTLAAQSRGRMKTVLLKLRDSVAAGVSFGDALAREPGAFDEVSIQLARVGEDAGTLDVTLARLAQFRARREQLVGRLATVMIYPAIVLCMAVFAGIFLMTFIVPAVLQPLIEQGQKLPLPTRVVLAVSNTLTSYGWIIGPVAAASVVALVLFLRAPRGRRLLHETILRLPLIGPLAQKQQIVRVAVVMGTLLRSGVVFERAVQIASRAVNFIPMREALERAERAVHAGADLSAAMSQGRAIPPTVVQLFAVGQQSGKLEDMLDALAEGYDRQVQTASARAAAVLEPATIVVLAGVVLTIVLATILPILQAGEAIQ